MGTTKHGHAPLQIMAFWADTQIMPEIDSCTLPMFSGVATNQNGGITQGRSHGRYRVHQDVVGSMGRS